MSAEFNTKSEIKAGCQNQGPSSLGNDPSGAMLSDITLPEKEVLTRNSDQLRDLLASEFNTTYFRSSLDRIRFLPNGHVQFDDQEMPCTPGFLDQAIAGIGMSHDYAYRTELPLFSFNFEEMKTRRSKGITVCCQQGVAVSMANAEYRPVRTADVLASLVDADFWKLNTARVSDNGVDIDYVQPGCTVSPEPGDVIQFGIRISNSETGYNGLKASLFSLRLVCSNGAVMKDGLGTARWNYDPRMAYTTSIAKFQKDLFKLTDKQGQQAKLYGASLQRNLLEDEFVNVWRRVRSAFPTADAVDAALKLDSSERQLIQATVRERVAGLPAAPTHYRVWDIHNHITEAAQRLNFSRRSRLEQIGGGLLAEAAWN